MTIDAIAIDERGELVPGLYENGLPFTGNEVWAGDSVYIRTPIPVWRWARKLSASEVREAIARLEKVRKGARGDGIVAMDAALDEARQVLAKLEATP